MVTIWIKITVIKVTVNMQLLVTILKVRMFCLMGKDHLFNTYMLESAPRKSGYTILTMMTHW